MFREVVHLQQNLLVPLDRRRGEARQDLSITTCYRVTVRLRQNLSITRPNLLQLSQPGCSEEKAVEGSDQPDVFLSDIASALVS